MSKETHGNRTMWAALRAFGCGLGAVLLLVGPGACSGGDSQGAGDAAGPGDTAGPGPDGVADAAFDAEVAPCDAACEDAAWYDAEWAADGLGDTLIPEVVPPTDLPQGDTPQGDTPQGDTPQGDTPQGDTPQGDTPQGDTPQGDTGPATCGTGSPAAFVACVETPRVEADLRTVAQERVPGTAHWQAVQDLCAARFAELGYTVTRQDFGGRVNVIGELPGLSRPDERVLIGAHYDHVPFCAGADDNASGIAGVLEAARVLAGGSFARTLVVACFDDEESGRAGSHAMAQTAAAAGQLYVVAFVFEMIGYKSDVPGSQTMPDGFDAFFPAAGEFLAAREGRGDFLAVFGGDDATAAGEALVRYGAEVGLPTLFVPLAGWMRTSSATDVLKRSDHASFWTMGAPALMLTDTAEMRNPHYHCTGGPDVPEDLDFAFAANIVAATVGAAAEQLDAADEVVVGETWLPQCALDPQAAQGCADPAHKCAALLDPFGYYVEQCIALRGTAAAGEGCTRPTNKVGDDTCDRGLFCTRWGVPAGGESERRCRPTCSRNDDCAAGEVCTRFWGTHNIGTCMQGCDVFAPACAAGLKCTPALATDSPALEFYCDRPNDPVANEGEACVNTWDCKPGLGCDMVGKTCRPFCSTAHPCGNDAECRDYGYPLIPADTGLCIPL